MLFNSWTFAIFLPLVFLLYWFVFDYAMRKNSRQLLWQNIFVIVASYIFYGWWDWRFLILIAFTSLCSWGSGLFIGQSPKPKLWLTLNIAINLLILGIFKYFNFFVDSFCALFGLSNTFALQVILPVGISFYTFQALSYSIDVYRKKIAPTKDIVAFFAFVSFFPQLVAGPIERATNLLPQFEKKRVFDYSQAVDGLRQMLWGMFKKVVVADTLARHVNLIYGDLNSYEGSTILLATFCFAIQIYCDFSGYSDIALGTAKLFGITLNSNFKTPYFSRNVAEFWKRWHISLNTWFVDYVYIPLGGSREGKWKTVRNTFAIFLLSGLWHGANWTFVLWGLYHAILFIPNIFFGKRVLPYAVVAEQRILPSWKETGRMTGTFLLVVLGWIFFRADSMASVKICFSKIFSAGLLTMPHCVEAAWYIPAFLALVVLVVVEWFVRDVGGYPSFTKYHFNRPLRYMLYLVQVVSILAVYYMGQGEVSNKFIYFQF